MRGRKGKGGGRLSFEGDRRSRPEVDVPVQTEETKGGFCGIAPHHLPRR